MKQTAKFFAAITAILGWFAVSAQFYLIMQGRTLSTTETIIKFLSYFTILTNIVVAIGFTFTVFKKAGFFSRPGTQTAITVYIVVVGAVYNVVLRFLWNPQGLQLWVDELLHTVVPLLSLLYWILFVPKSTLKWKDSIVWMGFPVGYTVLIVIRGAFSGYYPYPFIDVPEIGYPQALLNGCILMLVFMGLSLFLIAVAKFTSRKQIKSL